MLVYGASPLVLVCEGEGVKRLVLSQFLCMIVLFLCSIFIVNSVVSLRRARKFVLALGPEIC